MGHLLPALTEEKFVNQRDVVLNERRQNYENRPYGLAGVALSAGAVSARSPVSLDHHRRPGRSARCHAGRRADVLRDLLPPWQRVADAGGRHRARTARSSWPSSTSARFRAGPSRHRCRRRPPRIASRSLLLEDRVELPRLYLSWHSPAMFAPGDAELDLAADVLAHGKTSRLYRLLVYERRVATDVSAYQHSRELSGLFQIALHGGGRRGAAGAGAGDYGGACTRWPRTGPTADELARAEAQTEAQFVYRLQTVGGFGGKSDQLNAYNVFKGNPGFFDADLDALPVGDRRGHGRGRRALARGPASRRIERRAAGRAGARAARRHRGPGLVSRVDRTTAAGPGPAAPVRVPDDRADAAGQRPARARDLAQIGARRGERAADARRLVGGRTRSRPGLASLTADLLDEGSRGQSALEISDRIARMGGDLDLEVSHDATVVSLATLDRFLDDGPVSRARDLHRAQPRRARLPARPAAAARAAASAAGSSRPRSPTAPFAQLLYQSHPYAQPGHGTGESLAAMTLDGRAAVPRGDVPAGRRHAGASPATSRRAACSRRRTPPSGAGAAIPTSLPIRAGSRAAGSAARAVGAAGHRAAARRGAVGAAARARRHVAARRRTTTRWCCSTPCSAGSSSAA